MSEIKTNPPLRQALGSVIKLEAHGTVTYPDLEPASALPQASAATEVTSEEDHCA